VFDNLIGHSSLKNQLASAVRQKNLSPSMLFYGENYSGKLTAALELSRTLSCQKEADWRCGCHHCEAARRLLHPYTVMLGNRYFSYEIAQSREALLKAPGQPAMRFLYLRSVRKLLRRFDPFLWEEDEQRYKKAKNLIAPLGELLDSIEVHAQLPEEKMFFKLLETIEEKSAELAAILDGYTISIGQIRSISNWARTNAQSTKVIIMEEADKMQESGRNALLKILEEPPERLYFILMSRSRNTVMPTILSRVRSYAFMPRSSDEEHEVLQRIFKSDGQNISLRQFFSKAADEDIAELALAYWRGKKENRSFFESYQAKKADGQFTVFLEELTNIIRAEFHRETLDTLKAGRLMTEINKAKTQYAIYRQNPASLAERLFYMI
jgi:DNA polymerase III delta prime subunit